MKLQIIIAAAFYLFISIDQIAQAQCTNSPTTQSSSSFPSLNGKLVYHSYAIYGDGTSQMWVYDFKAKNLTQISSGWPIRDPMNGVWSPDGKWLVFMGISNNAWNIFAWPTDNSAAPYNLTLSSGTTRSEDPKFSADGSKIIFKQNFGNIYSAPFVVQNGIPTLGTLTNVSNNLLENSMPFYEPDNSGVLFAQGTGSSLQIFYKDLLSGITSLFADHGYYPIIRSDKNVFYSDIITGYDQVAYKVNATDSSTISKINDCLSNNSDAWPVNGTDYVFFSSTQLGNYQLYLGELASGKRWSLSPFGINSDTGRSYLGQAYYPDGETIINPPPPPSGSSKVINLSKGQICDASSYSTINNIPLVCNRAFDDNTTSTRWDSIEGASADPTWISINLGSQCAAGPGGQCLVTGIDLYWDSGAKVYKMQSSSDGVNWVTFYSKRNGTSYTQTLIKALNVKANYIRLYGTKRATAYGYSLNEMKIWGCTAASCK